MTLVETEHVLVVPTQLLHSLGHFQGFCGEVDRYLDALLDPAHMSYRPRREMEEDPNFKQLIPYVVLCHRDEQQQSAGENRGPSRGSDRVFQYTRGKGQGEKRLHSKRSIGIGGHISSDDAAANSDLHPYEEGLQRELAEEIQLNTAYEARCVGLINDDETEVGRVHLGVVHVFDLETPQVRPNEEDIADSGFESVDQLLQRLEQFETWSQICLQALFAKE